MTQMELQGDLHVEGTQEVFHSSDMRAQRLLLKAIRFSVLTVDMAD